MENLIEANITGEKALMSKDAKPSSARSRRWPARCALAVLGGLLLLAPAWTRGVDASREHQLKAAFLYNFTKFVEWPATSFATQDDPMVFGVLGRGSLLSELEKAVENRKIGERGLVVRPVSRIDQASRVHVLFMAEAEDAKMEEWFEVLTATPVLTVGESAEFERHGGIITFVQEDDKLRFNINAGSAEKSGIKMSSQLLKLAKSVKKR